MRNLNRDKLITRRRGRLPSGESLTLLQVDLETFHVIWNELRKLTPEDAQTGEEVDEESIEKFHRQQLIPLVVRTETTEHLFRKLGVRTKLLCGEVRGAHPELSTLSE